MEVEHCSDFPECIKAAVSSAFPSVSCSDSSITMAETEALEDCTAELPQHIMHHILSFLGIPEQAAHTSLLSKAWWFAWRTRPILEFWYNSYSDQTDTDIHVRQKRRSDFVNCINTTLQRYHEHKNGIDSLEVTSPPSVSPEDVNRWIQIAVENGVKILNIAAPSGSESFILAPTVFEAKSITELHLWYFQLKPQEIKTIRCYNLHKLWLFHVKLDEVLFQRILSSCLLIHWLTIFNCVGLANLKVTKLQKLELLTMSVKGSSYVEVEAPSLRHFDYHTLFFPMDDDEVKERISSTHPTLRMHTSPNLKCLQLNNIGITDEFLLNIAEKFPHLEDLEIRGGDDLERIKISSHSIKRINLVLYREPEEVQIDIPSLHRFEFTGESINLFSFTAPSGPCVSKIKLDWWGWLLPAASWFSRLKDMLTKLSQCKVSLRLCFGDGTVASTTVDEVRSSAILPLPQFEKLSLYFYEGCLDAADSILDAIFWTCRPKTIAQNWNNCLELDEIHLAKVIYEMFLLGGN